MNNDELMARILGNQVNFLRDEYKKEYGEKICFHCGEPAFDKCYSEQGLKEVLISGCCEKCFDEMFAGEDDLEGEE